MVIITKTERYNVVNFYDFKDFVSKDVLEEFIEFSRGDIIIGSQESLDISAYPWERREFYEWCLVVKEDSPEEEWGWHSFIPADLH